MLKGDFHGYIWGPINAEDLIAVPGTDWILTSGLVGRGQSGGAYFGRLYAVHRHDRSCNEIFPHLVTFEPDNSRFGKQDILNPREFKPHGIDVGLGPAGVPELYVVNHGGRESVEVFEILLDGLRPTLRWIGGAQLPGTSYGNDVACISGGGFLVTASGEPYGETSVTMEETMQGAESGGVLEWSSKGGWSLLADSQMCVANGIAVSSDEQWVYIGGWNSRTIKRIRRSGAAPETRVAAMPIMVDNITWSSTGQLLAAGHYGMDMREFMARLTDSKPRLGVPSRIVSIDPETLASEVLIDYGPETFGAATTGLQVGDEIWIGSARDRGLARFRDPMRRP
jgi:hypothetical protein